MKFLSFLSEKIFTSPSNEWITFLRDSVIILLIVLTVRSFVASPFRISGSSMEESYHNGEFIIIDKFSYLHADGFSVGEPKRGDVVVMAPHAGNQKDYYIKRIVGLPGDTVKLEGGGVFVKKPGTDTFVELNEGYLSPLNKGKTFPGKTSKESSFSVPDGEYFLLGDNRGGSADSRDCFYSCTSGTATHFIGRSDIVGKLWVTLGSIRIFDVFELRPELHIIFAEPIRFDPPARLFATPRDWDYPELQ